MHAAGYEFHQRRARQHRLFAQSTTNRRVMLSHQRLAAAYWAAACFAYRREKRNRPA